MNKYRVYWLKELGGYVTVQAETQAEAEASLSYEDCCLIIKDENICDETEDTCINEEEIEDSFRVDGADLIEDEE